jgi:anti-sigma B factor antagonist
VVNTVDRGLERVGRFRYSVAEKQVWDHEQWHEIRVSVRPSGERVIQAVGDVDMLTAPELDGAIVDNLAARPYVLILDLSEVTFLASTGLATLMRAREGCSAIGVALRVVGAEQQVLRPMELTGLIDLFDVYPDIESALGGEVGGRVSRRRDPLLE